MDDELALYDLPGFHEPFSAISHMFGAVLFLYLGLLLLRRGRGDNARLVCLGVFVFAGVFLFSMSGVYHMLVRKETAHGVMERLDHAAIFVLIAGTFTPAHGILCRGLPRWLPLLLIWTAAITGIVLKTVFFDDLGHGLGLSFYLTLGWLGLFSGVYLARRFGWKLVRPLLWGGLAYSAGGIMDHFQWLVVIPGVAQHHEIFHLLVLLGALCHWYFVWQIAGGDVFVGRP